MIVWIVTSLLVFFCGSVAHILYKDYLLSVSWDNMIEYLTKDNAIGREGKCVQLYNITDDKTARRRRVLAGYIDRVGKSINVQTNFSEEPLLIRLCAYDDVNKIKQCQPKLRKQIQILNRKLFRYRYLCGGSLHVLSISFQHIVFDYLRCHKIPSSGGTAKTEERRSDLVF